MGTDLAIRDLVIEVLAADGPDVVPRCAILARPGCQPQIENVELVGEVVGVPGVPDDVSSIYGVRLNLLWYLH